MWSTEQHIHRALTGHGVAISDGGYSRKEAKVRLLYSLSLFVPRAATPILPPSTGKRGALPLCAVLR